MKGVVPRVNPVRSQFLSNIFLVEKKGGGEQTSVKPEESEHLHSLSALQDERSP